jgi:hypothetical protein
MTKRALVLALPTALLVACYQPPAYVVPTEVPTPTTVPANATIIAALQTGPTATNIAVAGATSVAASPMRILSTSLDPQDPSNSAVTVMNISQATVDLSGWSLLFNNYKVTLPSTQYMSVGAGSKLNIHLGNSPSVASGQDVYVGLGALQNTPRVNADQTVLLDSQGHVASVYPPPT